MKYRLVLFLCIWNSIAVQFCVADDIHEAVRSGNTDKLASILGSNASAVNQPDENGNMPIHIAVECNNARAVSMLLSKNADPLARDRSGRSALHAAVDCDNAGCAKMIIMKTNTGYTDPILDARQKDGAEALKDGTMEKANSMLGRLVRLEPADENINFAYGLTWLSLGDGAPAGTAFERALQVNPRNYRTRVELARARLMSKRFYEGQKELEKVLAAEIPDAVRQTVEACLKDMRGRISKWFWSGNVGIAGLYDDNVNVGPDSSSIRISPVTIGATTITELQLTERSMPKDTAGVAVSAASRWIYDIGEPNNWLLTADADFYCNFLEEDDYETMSAQAGVGIKRLFSKGFFQAPLRARYIEYGGDPLVWVYGLQPTFAYSAGGGLSFISTMTAELRDFDTLTDRDSWFLALGEIVRKSFERGKYSIYGGAEVQHDNTDSAVYEYDGITGMAGAEARLPWKMGLFAEARYSYRTYKEKLLIAPEDRKDNQYQLAAGLTHDMGKKCSVSLSYSFTKNDSTFDIYEYNRQVTTLGTSFRF